MQKDFKIGMLLGLVLAMAATLWLATRPGLTPDARILRAHEAGSPPEFGRQPPSPVMAKGPNERGDNLNAASVIEGQGVQVEPSNRLELTRYEESEKIRTQRFHIVRRRETLSGISQKYYGSANKWQKILDANHDVIKDVRKIKPGTKLIIPD